MDPVQSGLNALHLLFGIIWLGGLIYQSIAVLPLYRPAAEGDAITKPLLIESLKRFRPIILFSLVGIVATGVMRIVALGGMKHLPTPLHIKITVALVMIGLTLYSLFSVLPVLQRSLAQGVAAPGKFWLYQVVNTIVILLGLVVLGLLVTAGIL